MKTRLVWLALCLGCSRAASHDSAVSDRLQVAARAAMSQMKADGVEDAAAPRAGASPVPPAEPAPSPANGEPDAEFSDARKLVRNAELRIQVESVALAMARVDTMTTARGATIADSHASRDPNGRGDGRMVVRVPAAKLDVLLGDLRAIGKVQDEETSTDDITKQFTDLETRIAVKEETVARLRALLATRAGKLADVLDLERELSRAVTELEQMKGERRYYEQQVAMSTVTITLVEPNVIIATGVSTSAGDALRHSLELLHASALMVIYTITFLAPWIPVIGGAWWVLRRLRSRRAQPASPPAASAT